MSKLLLSMRKKQVEKLFLLTKSLLFNLPQDGSKVFRFDLKERSQVWMACIYFVDETDVGY